MREAFRAQLRALVDRVVEYAGTVETGIGGTGRALLDADLAQARAVLDVLAPLERLHAEVDDEAVSLLARQQPVASDLRTIVAVLRMSSDLERMGVLARHLAEIARARYPRCAVPVGLRAEVLRMGQAARRLMAEARAVIAAGDADAALGMDAEDDEMDRLRVEVYERLLTGVDGLEPGQVMDVALITRYYERFADHAVSLARCVAFRAGRAGLDDVPAEPG